MDNDEKKEVPEPLTLGLEDSLLSIQNSTQIIGSVALEAIKDINYFEKSIESIPKFVNFDDLKLNTTALTDLISQIDYSELVVKPSLTILTEEMENSLSNQLGIVMDTTLPDFSEVVFKPLMETALDEMAKGLVINNEFLTDQLLSVPVTDLIMTEDTSFNPLQSYPSDTINEQLSRIKDTATEQSNTLKQMITEVRKIAKSTGQISGDTSIIKEYTTPLTTIEKLKEILLQNFFDKVIGAGIACVIIWLFVKYGIDLSFFFT